ncbi:MAG: gamma-glutamyltransferase [Pseudomonadota bacterium]
MDSSTKSARLAHKLLVLFLLLGIAAGGRAGDAAFSIPEPLAANAAEAVLRDGGNAVDAAVATAFVLAVTQPDAGNIGGGGFMTLFFEGATRFLDYRETAPRAATRDMYLDERGVAMSDASLIGHRASGVPGTVAGLWEVHRRHGRLAWERLVAPAIELALAGYRVPLWMGDLVAESQNEYAGRTNFGTYYRGAKTGALFRQPELAATLERIAAKGADEFYRGETARLLLAEMERGDGLIDAQDLENYRPRWREPLRAEWREFEVVTAPPPSSGGLAILQYLRIKDMLRGEFDAVAHNSVRYVHLKAEIEKRIFADRAEHLGDPDFVTVPVSALLDDAYLRTRAAQVNTEQPSATAAVEPWRESAHTTHFSILDAEGNAVANTYTLNTDFGSGVVVEGAGFLLNNEMDDFSAAPGVANFYGVTGKEANAIAPRKRMLSSMAPTLLVRDGQVAMAVGAMGGSTIFTTVYQLISNVVEYGMNATDAQAAPRVHHQLLPDQLITYSPSTPLADDVASGLRKLGYRVEPHAWEFGNAQLVWVDAQGNTSAAADPRFAGVARVIPGGDAKP